MLKCPEVPFIESRYGGGALTDTPFYLINHSLEAPAKKGMAKSLAEGWFRNPSNETSVHGINDPGASIGTFDLERQVWGCGTGNRYGLQFEHTGYAEWSAAQWRAPNVLASLKHSAVLQAWVWHEVAMKRYGIDYYPEWLSLTDIAGRRKWGLITHNDARLVFGGTSHWDPGPNFPYEELKKYIWAELDKLTGKKNTPKPKPNQPVDKRGYYTVRKGDTLSEIASSLLGKASRWTEIAKLNNLKNPNVINVGQQLKLPNKTAKPKPTPKPKYTAPPQRAFPLPRSDYFGLITGPARSHGGYYESEKKYIRWIQTRLNELGYGRGLLVDGVFGGKTRDAVARWQRDMHNTTTSLYGQVWWDDWANLIKDR